MGGPSTGGGGGGVGPAGVKVSKAGKKTYGTKKDAKKTSSRNEVRKAIKEFEPLPVKIIKAIAEVPKKNKKSKSGDVYGGKTAGYNEAKEKIDYKAPTTPIGGNDGNDNPPPKIETKKSIEQPKVKSQMDNTEVKSKNITADKTAPTTTEMPTETELTEDEKLIKRKRGRKTKTILSSVTGDNTKATLSRRTLLG
jgi:hypothetical protein